jgi:hypothetical protein
VDAAEHAFVPLCIYNNTRGDHDAKIRTLFKERAWNNPVVRFIDTRRKDVVPRLHSDWTARALTAAMVSALEKKKQPVPAYLESLAAEEAARKHGLQTAVFGMG